MSASSPSTVFPSVKQPCWQVAPACGERAKHDRASGISSKTSRKGERFIDCSNGRVVFIMRRGSLNLPSLARQIAGYGSNRSEVGATIAGHELIQTDVAPEPSNRKAERLAFLTDRVGAHDTAYQSDRSEELMPAELSY